MGTSGPAKVIGRMVQIKPGEKKLAVLIFSYFFLIAAPYTIINALRTSNFLFKEGVGWLPVVYLLAVVATGLIVLLQSRIKVRKSIRILIIPSLIFFGVSGLLLQWVMQTDTGRRSVFLTYFYWVWASVLIIVLITGFWMTVNEIYNPRQAKRLIVFLNSGGLLGSVMGGLLVMFLSEGPVGPYLLPLACVMLFACVGIVNAIFRLHESESPEAGESGKERPARLEAGVLKSLRAVRKDRFLVLIAAIVAIGIVVSTCIEFQFLSAAYGHYGSQATALQAFFGFFEAALTVFALFLNFLMAGFLLRKLTAPHTLLLTPAVLLAGSVALLLTPFGLLSGVFIRGIDEGLAFSVNHPFREIMYIPIPARLRHQAKAFIEMFVSQFAKVAGAVVLLAFAFLLNKKVEGLTPQFNPQLARYLSLVVIAFLIPWILIGLKVGKEYLAALRENIQPLWDPAELGLSEKVDVEYAKLVFDTVDSQSYSSALYALHLFDLLAQDKLSPDLKKVIAAKAEEVRAKALSDRLEEGAAALFPDARRASRRDHEDRDPAHPILGAYQRVDEVLYGQDPGTRPESTSRELMELAKAIGLMDPASLLAAECLARLIHYAQPGCPRLRPEERGPAQKEDDIPAIVRKLTSPPPSKTPSRR